MRKVACAVWVALSSVDLCSVQLICIEFNWVAQIAYSCMQLWFWLSLYLFLFSIQMVFFSNSFEETAISVKRHNKLVLLRDIDWFMVCLWWTQALTYVNTFWERQSQETVWPTWKLSFGESSTEICSQLTFITFECGPKDLTYVNTLTIKLAQYAKSSLEHSVLPG